MRTDRLAVGGMLLLGAAAGAMAGPKLINKGRLAARRAVGTTYRDGVSSPGMRTTADPAAGRPA